MDDRLKMILARRSVRDYTRETVAESDLRSLLEAAMAAPSANNRQPWRFVVVRDRTILDLLAAAHPYGRMIAKAPLAFAVCGDASVSDWWVQDCSAATENLLVAAAGLGLGAVWVGCHGRPEREEAVRRCLGIPKAIGVLCLVAVGHPAERLPPRTQYDPAKLHAERW